VGVAHAEVEAPLAYDAAAVPNPAVAGAAGKEPSDALEIAREPAAVSTESRAVDAEIALVKMKKHRGFFHSVGHFFARIFGD
jgi:hypothetical protein